MAWSLLAATGSLERAAKAPAGKFSAGKYLSGKSSEPPAALTDVLHLFADVFGNAPGAPEVGFQPSMTHALFLMNDRLVLDWLRPFEGGLVSRLSRGVDDAVAEELYLSVLTRMPAAAERKEVAGFLERNGKRRDEALGELAWALIASTEFRMNH
jgi:hypothetical protein